MTTSQLVIIAAITTAWFTLIVGGVLLWVWMTRTTPRKGKRKSAASKARVNEDMIDERKFGDLLIRLWRNSHGGNLWAGITLLKVLASASFRTLGVYQLLRLPRAMVFACDRFLEEDWLPSKDRPAWILLRKAMRAAADVIRAAREERKEQLNGKGDDVDVDVTAHL